MQHGRARTDGLPSPLIMAGVGRVAGGVCTGASREAWRENWQVARRGGLVQLPHPPAAAVRERPNRCPHARRQMGGRSALPTTESLAPGHWG
jgi:hypothetical protein